MLRKLETGYHKAGVTDFLNRRFNRKLPQGVIRFPRKLKKINWNEVNSVREKFDLDDFFILHGMAVEKDGKAVVVCGPPSIGKTSILELFEREKIGKALDDGILLIGRNAMGEFFLVPTGMMQSRALISTLSRVLRNITGYNRPYTETGLIKKRLKRRHAVDRIIYQVSKVGGRVLTKNRHRERFEPRTIPLQKCVFVTNPQFEEKFKEKIISGEEIKELGLDEVATQLSPKIDLTMFKAETPQLRTKIWEAIKK